MLPEPDVGGLPVLKLLELPELELPGVLELGEGWEALGVLTLDLPARLARWVLGTAGGRELPDPEPMSAACPAAPGRKSVITPVAAIPPAPVMAVTERTMDRPRFLTATALAILLRFMATSPRQLADSSGAAGGRRAQPHAPDWLP